MDIKLFPKKLKALRVSKNLTQIELAKNIGITKQSLSLYENGLREPGLYTMVKLAKYFDVNLDFFIDNDVEINKQLISIDTSFLKSDIDTLKKSISNIESNITLFKQVISNLESTLDMINSNTDSVSNSNKKYSRNFKEEYSSEITPNIIDFKEYQENIKCREIPILGDVAAGNPCYVPGDILDYFYIPEDKLSPYKDYYILNIKGDSMNKLFNDKDLILVECTSLISTSDIAIVLVNNEEATVKKVDIAGHNITLIPLSSNPIHKSKTYNISDVCIQGKVVCKISDLFKPTFNK